MASKKMSQVALKATVVKNTVVRFRVKRVKAAMGKIIGEQKRLKEEQRRIRVRFGEVERQCDQLKEETEMIVKQTARTQIKIALMFKILKARENGDSVQATTLTQFLRSELRTPTYNQISNMAPRKMKQEALKPTMAKNVGVRFQTERLKAKVEKIIDEQQRIRKEQRRIRVRCREVERQCDRLKEETEMIMKQAAKTQIKLLLMFKILKARESGDSIQVRLLPLKQQMQAWLK